MSATRRDFINLAAGGALAAAAMLPARPTLAADPARVKAIAFDGFPIIDPRPVVARAEALFPGKGMALSNAWRSRQFEYTWLRTLAGKYADFWQISEEALVFAARTLKLEMSADQRDELMQTYLTLKAWPDVAPALRTLKAAGFRLAFLSNFTTRMLDAAIRNAGLEGLLEEHLSTDRVRAFKPDPRAYQMGLDAFGARKEEIVFAAFAGWDVAGAKWFGYPTFWVNRSNAPIEELGVAPDATGANLSDLVRFVGL